MGCLSLPAHKRLWHMSFFESFFDNADWACSISSATVPAAGPGTGTGPGPCSFAVLDSGHLSVTNPLSRAFAHYDNNDDS